MIPSLPENWQYIHTECSSGWWPHNGFCYRVLSETEGTWEEASEACDAQGGNLTSIRSLSEVEMLLDLLAECESAVGDKPVWFLGVWGFGYAPAMLCVQILGIVRSSGSACGSGDHRLLWSGLTAHQSLSRCGTSITPLPTRRTFSALKRTERSFSRGHS